MNQSTKSRRTKRPDHGDVVKVRHFPPFPELGGEVAEQLAAVIKTFQERGYKLVDITCPTGFAILLHRPTASYLPVYASGTQGAFARDAAGAMRWITYHDRVLHGLVPLDGELWNYKGRNVVILGNTERDDGTLWCADNSTGTMLYAPVCDLDVIPERQTQSLEETARRCERWASEGNAAACWWLGHHYEFGGSDGTANGPKALAYYFAAARIDPEAAADWHFLHDPFSLFSLSRPITRREEAAANRVIACFPEIAEIAATGRCYLRDWREAIAVAQMSPHSPRTRRPAAKPVG